MTDVSDYLTLAQILFVFSPQIKNAGNLSPDTLNFEVRF